MKYIYVIAGSNTTHYYVMTLGRGSCVTVDQSAASTAEGSRLTHCSPHRHEARVSGLLCAADTPRANAQSCCKQCKEECWEPFTMS